MTSRIESWPDAVEEIFQGDQSVMFAYVTPAKGVVMLPLTNFALHDREKGRTGITSSLGAWRKLNRIEKNPRVALAFHTRAHASAGRDRPEYVLVQGNASFDKRADREWLESMEHWEAKAGTRDVGPLMDRWMRVYHWERVPIWIDIERIVVWPDLRRAGEPEVIGAPLPEGATPPQKPPKNGTAPRIKHHKAAKRAASLDDVLLGWVGADGFPVMAPVEVGATTTDGIELTTSAAPGTIPPGGRRAGLTAHWFSEQNIGQHQRVHTGWLDAGEDGRLVYAHHTEASYRLPPWKPLYRVIVGAFTRIRQREARKAGFFDPDG